MNEILLLDLSMIHNNKCEIILQVSFRGTCLKLKLPIVIGSEKGDILPTVSGDVVVEGDKSKYAATPSSNKRQVINTLV